MKQLTELEKMKYWLDGEITILHAMFGVVGILLVEGWAEILLGFYIFFCVVYAGARMAVVASQHQGYLKLPRKGEEVHKLTVDELPSGGPHGNG